MTLSFRIAGRDLPFNSCPFLRIFLRQTKLFRKKALNCCYWTITAGWHIFTHRLPKYSEINWIVIRFLVRFLQLASSFFWRIIYEKLKYNLRSSAGRIWITYCQLNGLSQENKISFFNIFIIVNYYFVY